MICVSDNIQITRKTIETALKTFSKEPLEAWALACEHSGADIIDINTGPLSRSPRESMEFFITTIQDATDLPLMIDTSNAEAMEAGLKCCRQTPYLNGFSLEPKKLDTILSLAVKYKTPIVGYLLNPDSSVPVNAAERMQTAVTLFDEASKRGLSPDQLIIDPVLVPLSWPDGSSQAMDVLEVIRSLPDLLGYPVRSIVGLSNLTTGALDLSKKIIMEKTYAAMLCCAGIGMILMNTLHTETVHTIRAASLLCSNRIFSWEELGESPQENELNH